MRKVVLAAVAVLLLLSGCVPSGNPGLPELAPPSEAAPGGRSTPAPDAAPSPAPDGDRVAVVGDSITDVQSEDFSGGRIDPDSWVAEVLDEGRTFAGGWAVWGATTDQMARGVQPLDADVLLILAGTNDVAFGIPFAETAANLVAIADTVGAPRVVVSAIPPLDPLPEEVERFNSELRSFVRSEGWEWVDPMARIESDGQFRAGMSDDGIHPTARASRIIGRAIESAVWPEELDEV